MNKKPVIGIVLDLLNNSEKNKYSAFPWYALRQNYADCVIQSGGTPIMIPYDHSSIDNITNLIDGLIIGGGDMDVPPEFYHQRILSDKVTLNYIRSKFELELTKKALEKDMPFLGICNGMQLLNVILGGDLIQHIPDYINSEVNHEQPAPKHTPSHLIAITPNSTLAKLAGNVSSIMVNSTHHQAVKNLGSNLIVSAIAQDGIIEAIESVVHKYAIGVEWHPEYLNSDLDLRLFRGLIESALY